MAKNKLWIKRCEFSKQSFFPLFTTFYFFVFLRICSLNRKFSVHFFQKSTVCLFPSVCVCVHFDFHVKFQYVSVMINRHKISKSKSTTNKQFIARRKSILFVSFVSTSAFYELVRLLFLTNVLIFFSLKGTISMYFMIKWLRKNQPANFRDILTKKNNVILITEPISFHSFLLKRIGLKMFFKRLWVECFFSVSSSNLSFISWLQ